MKTSNFAYLFIFFIFSGISFGQTPCPTQVGTTDQTASNTFVGLAWGAIIQPTVSGTVNNISVYCAAASDHAFAGIYDADVSAVPTTLLAQSSSQLTSTGWNNFSIASTNITSGNYYWLVWQQLSGTEATGTNCVDSNNCGSYFHIDKTYDGTIPTSAASFVNYVGSGGVNFSIYASVCALVPTNTPTPTFTPTNTPTATPTPYYAPSLMLMGVEHASSGPYLPSGMWMGSMDSFTQATDQWPPVLIPRMKIYYGDGGPGLRMFDTSLATSQGDTYAISTNMVELHTDVVPGFNTIPADYSCDAHGVSTGIGDGTDYAYYQPTGSWANSNLYYLQQSGGGTFVCGYTDTYGNALHNSVTINTSGALTLVQQPVTVANGYPVLVCQKIGGEVCIFAATFTNPSGTSFGVNGRSGDYLAFWPYLDDSFFTQWMTFLKPAVYVINAGTNDRNITDAVTYQGWIDQFITRIRSGSPNTRIVLMYPNQTSDWATSNMPFYFGALQTESMIRGTLFFDNTFYLGSYSNALANGWMRDTSHMNQAGSTIISNNMFTKFKF